MRRAPPHDLYSCITVVALTMGMCHLSLVHTSHLCSPTYHSYPPNRAIHTGPYGNTIFRNSTGFENQLNPSPVEYPLLGCGQHPAAATTGKIPLLV